MKSKSSGVNDDVEEVASNPVAIGFNKDSCRNVLAKYLILDELSFNHVEGEGFKQFCLEMQPRFQPPSRMTVARDIFQLYLDEKIKLKNSIYNQRLCLTTDTWTSIQNIVYMCITAHFIDANWRMHKRIISFFQVPNHKGDTIGREILSCMKDWGITKLFTITVDNASSNKTAMQYLIRELGDQFGAILMDGKFLQLRCCAHIINLIVCAGLDDLHISLASIRNAVRYVRSSPARLKRFKECFAGVKIETKSFLALDVCTRWNSTYLMLETALKFQKAFRRMDGDANYDQYFQDKPDGKCKREGPPIDLDWDNAKAFVKFLKTFYEATLKFSGSTHVTSNIYFQEVSEIRQDLNDLIDDQYSIVCSMAINMKAKFEEYWGGLDDINEVLVVASVLDPMYKMGFLRLSLQATYNDTLITKKLCKKIEDFMRSLCTLYNELEGNNSGNQISQSTIVLQSEATISSSSTSTRSRKLHQAYLQSRSQQGASKPSDDIDRYLMDSVEDYQDNFDILAWWRLNGHKHGTLVVESLIHLEVH